MNNRFWARDLAAAAQAVKEHCPEDVSRSISIADDVMEHRFLFRDHWEMERTNQPVQFGPAESDIDWACIPAGDVEWLYAMNRHTSFVNLGKAWRCTGERRYAEKFVRLIEDWISRVELNEQSQKDTWRSLEAGLRCESWLRALRLFENSDLLTDRLLRKIEACLLVHGDYLVRRSEVFHRLSNWGVLQDHGLFLLGVYFDRTDWKNLALERLDNELHRQVMRDGSHWEQSPMYHCEVLHCAMDTLLVARQNSIEPPERFVDSVHRMCRALAAWITPAGRLVCQSDSDDTDARDILVQGALLLGDPELMAAAGKKIFEENFWDFGGEVLEMVRTMARCAGQMPGSTALADSGNYMLRAGVGEGAAYLHFHCGSMGGGHGHADLLHIDAGIGGEDVLIDSGRYTYVNTPLRLALKGPAAHNTTRVDGLDFSLRQDTWAYRSLALPVKGQHCFTAAADLVSGMHLGYLEQGVVPRRRVVWLKKLNAAVILDDFHARSGETHCYEQSFHFGPGTLRWNGGRADWQGKRAGASLVCLGGGEGAPEKAPYSRDYNSLEEGDVLRVRRECTGWGSMVAVLAMSPAGVPELQAELLAVRRPINEETVADSVAQAVRVTVGGEQAVVVLCNSDVTTLLEAGGFEGYGQVVVYGSEQPQGLCLSW